MWTSTIAGLESIDKLWTGIGGNGFARLQVMHGVVIDPPRHVQPHNWVVQSLCDWGIVGSTLLTAFFCRTVAGPLIPTRRQNDPTAVAGIVYLLVTGMLDATLYHLEHLIYLAIALAYWMALRDAYASKRIVLPASLVIACLIGFSLIHTQTFDYRIGLRWYFPTQ
jgi:hypothetical protein